ncbi:MAG: glycosyltransferase family 4 protein [Chloroflexi bacterium]|nr:glycosyltransferase family 4 protein [Chloroflexota bacterium]
MAAAAPGRPVHVAYVMSRFPKHTETFVLNEILEVQRHGIGVSVYPLLREHDRVLQPGAADLAARANYLPFLAPSFLGSHLQFLRRRPRAYLGSLVDLVRDNLGRPRFLAAGLVIFPKVVHAARLMAERGVDHVHCHFARHPALAGLIIHRLTGIPYSFTAHGSDVHVDRRMLCRKLSEAAFAIAISEFNRAVIEADCGRLPPERLRTLHVGVDTEVFFARNGTGSGPPNRLRIVCVGTLHEVKGQAHLIEACAILRDRGLDVRCRLVGRGPDERKLREAIERLGLQDQVTLVGPLPRDGVIGELERADVLAAPSVVSARGQREGIPVVLMEAMSCGLPVVASRLSGIPELVEHERTGLLVEPGRPADLAEALSRLASQPELRQRLGKEGRRTVERAFDLRANAARLAAMFEGTAAR